MGKINNFTINLELTTETTVFLKASKYLCFLVFITAYILFHYSYKSIFIVKIFINIKMFIVTNNVVPTKVDGGAA